MASVQAAKEVIYIQEVELRELNYVDQGLPGGANWILPTKEHPQAFLKDGFTIDVTGEVDRKVADCKIVRVAFGLRDSNVEIGIKLSKEGKYEYQSVQEQIPDNDDMLDTGRKWVIVEFPVNGGGIPPLGGKN